MLTDGDGWQEEAGDVERWARTAVEVAGAGVQAPGCRMSWGSMAALEEAFSY
jgi:hypothetical protein